jgi:8-oxo-dGTP pyrophosphatase MutT (NUDIX family)
MRVIAASSPAEACTTAADLIALVESPPPAHFTTSSSDRELMWKKSIISEIAALVAVCPSAATPLSHRIRPFLLSSDAAVRQLSHKIYRAATFGSRDLALLADEEAFAVPADAQQTVFATFYVKNHKPWLQYFEASRSDRGVQVCTLPSQRKLRCFALRLPPLPQMPLVLMIVRWDGMLGFAGGAVEPEEAADAKDGDVAARAAVENALRRELREELGVVEAGDLEHICTHLTAANGSRSHFWAREIDYEKFIEIESGVRRRVHFGSEVMGAFRAPLFPSQLESFFRSNFPPGALAQLLIFLSKKNLIPARELEAAVQVDFAELLFVGCVTLALSKTYCRGLVWSLLPCFSKELAVLEIKLVWHFRVQS